MGALLLLLLLVNIKRSTSSGLCPICDSCLLAPAIPLIELISGPSAILPAMLLSPLLHLLIAPMAF